MVKRAGASEVGFIVVAAVACAETSNIDRTTELEMNAEVESGLYDFGWPPKFVPAGTAGLPEDIDDLVLLPRKYPAQLPRRKG